MTESELRDFDKMLRSAPNFMDVVNSNIAYELSLLFGDIRRLLSGNLFVVDGDIRSITFGCLDEVYARITVDNSPSALFCSTEVIIAIPRSYIHEGLRLNPGTRISILARYNGFNGLNDLFTLISVEGVSKDLKFPYLVCSNSNCVNSKVSSLGYCSLLRTDKCPICNSDMKELTRI